MNGPNQQYYTAMHNHSFSDYNSLSHINRDMYDYDDPKNKIKAEARAAEEDWYLFSQSEV